MDTLADGNAGNPPLKRVTSYENSLMDGTFTSTGFDGNQIRAAQGSWQATAANQVDAQSSFMEDHGDTRRLLPTLFTGSDVYGNTQFSSLLMGSSTWDSKPSFISAASSGIAGIPLSITGNASGTSSQVQVVAQGNSSANALAIPGSGQLPGGIVHTSPGQGHTNVGLDYAQSSLEHMHLGQARFNGDLLSGKMVIMPQSWVPPTGSTPLDPAMEGLPNHALNFTAPRCLPSSLLSDPEFTERAAKFSAFGNMGLTENSLGADGMQERNKAKLNPIKPYRQFSYTAKRSGSNSPGGFSSYNSSKGLDNVRCCTKETGSAIPMEESCKGIETACSFLPTTTLGGEVDDSAHKQVCMSVNESDESLGQEVSSSCGAASMPVPSESSGKKRKAGLQEPKDGGGCDKDLKDMDPDDGRPKCFGGCENNHDKSLKPQEQTNSENSEESNPKSAKEASKPPEAPKPDFIHVRARRGQATDSHSLAERVRREKISERMKFLQDLVPGCSKVTGKAVMLDEIINYVQSLQRQVEFLSMKLAAVNPRVEFSMDNLFVRERPVQPRVVPPASTFGIQNPNLFPPPQPHQQPHTQMQPLDQRPSLEIHSFGSDPVLRRTISTPPVMETYGDSASQAALAWDDELQSVVQMSFAQKQAALDLQGSLFQGQMEVEQ